MHTQLQPHYAPPLVGVSTDAGEVRDTAVGSNAESLLSLGLPAPRLPRRAIAVRTGGTISLVFHAVFVITVLIASMRSASVLPPHAAPLRRPAASTPLQLPRIVFLQMPRPGGGGGGGGNRQQKPPSRAQGIGHDRVTLQVAKPVIASERPNDGTPSPQQVVLDAKPLASGTAWQAGLPTADPSLPFSQGPGFGGGVGEGTGTGIGSGTGPGLGPGAGGGFGGGAYRPGAGVVAPTLLKQVKPKYTPDALARKIQGTVALEVVVTRDGLPGAIRVTRSLDPRGLDEESIATVREWRFTPGRVGDTAVDVLVTILLDYRIN